MMAVSHPSSPTLDSGSRYRIGIDIGGTFTDLALCDADTDSLIAAKTLTTADDLSRGALAGIEAVLAQRGIALADVDQIVHATTHGANVIIEGAGARTSLLITEGFGDILLIQRQLRHSPYDLGLVRHAPLVPREWVLEVPERMRADGSIHRELDEAAVERIAERLVELDIEAVAVCLLHSYANADHERRVRAILSEFAPEIIVSLSSELTPVIREYERASTTVANAYIQPEFGRYLNNLRDSLASQSFGGELFVMQANGGIAGVQQAIDAPIRALESGPAGAVAMSAAFALGLELGDILLFDMGGTTAKAGLVLDGEPGTVDLFEVDRTLLRDGTGLPMLIPSVDIIEIGAGGGSIAQARLGIVEVGPQSAGADPGPACYGRGGTRPTVTDANLILGYLDPGFFNGGALRLDVDAARSAVGTHVAEPLGLTIEQAAWGIHEAVTGNMEHAIRAVSTDRGRDPRDLTLIASGGAGPLHAMRIARALGMPRVLVPAYAGVMSAVGLLQSDARFDLASSFTAKLDVHGIEAIGERLKLLEAEAHGSLSKTALPGARSIERWVDLRYRGQGHTVPVSLDAARERGTDAAAALRRRFTESYAALYGHGDPSGDIEITGVRVVAHVASPGVRFPKASPPDGAVPTPVPRLAHFPEAGGAITVPVFRRSALEAGTEILGAAIIEDVESTLTVLPGDRVRVDDHRHLLVEVAR